MGNLRAAFDAAAERYDRARPRYPPELFDDLAEKAGIGAGCRVLEIGCGTGQATVPLAGRGCQITAVELGADLARVARRNLARFPQAQIEVAAFEDWPLPPEPFDVVVAATAFHWLDPDVRTSKAARAYVRAARWRSSPRIMSRAAPRHSSTRCRRATSAGTRPHRQA